MTLTVSQAFELPDSGDIRAMDFVIRLREAAPDSEEAHKLVADYVVTPAVGCELPRILDDMKQVYDRREESEWMTPEMTVVEPMPSPTVSRIVIVSAGVRTRLCKLCRRSRKKFDIDSSDLSPGPSTSRGRPGQAVGLKKPLPAAQSGATYEPAKNSALDNVKYDMSRGGCECDPGHGDRVHEGPGQ